MIKVVLITSADILVHGIRSIFADVDDISLAHAISSFADFKFLADPDVPDVIIFDIQSLKTPKAVDMKNLVEYFRKILGSTGFIAITDWSNKSRYEFALQLGVKGYCLKRISAPGLITMVRAVAKGELYVHDEYAELVRLNSSPLFNNLFGERQLEILNLVLLGHSNKEIADLLHISQETVKSHIKVILKKLNAKDRTHAVSITLREMIDVFTQQNLYFN